MHTMHSTPCTSSLSFVRTANQTVSTHVLVHVCIVQLYPDTELYELVRVPTEFQIESERDLSRVVISHIDNGAVTST